MKFCTVINCMDGRVQLPVIRYLQERFGAEWVDTITEAGPCRIVAEEQDTPATDSIAYRLKISLEKHHSVGVAVVAHHDCAGNPVSKDEQLVHLKEAVRRLQGQVGETEVIGLWVDGDWEVREV